MGDQIHMKSMKRLGVAAAIVLGSAALAIPGAASAATSASNNTQVNINPGQLQLVTAPTVPNLSGNVTGATQTLKTQMTNWEVNDATGSGDGWTLAVNSDATQGAGLISQYNTGSSSYVAGGYAFPADSLVYSSTPDSAITGQNGTTGTAPLAASGPVALDSTTPTDIASAATGAGLGTWESNTGANDVSLTVPANVLTGTYQVVLDWNLASA